MRQQFDLGSIATTGDILHRSAEKHGAKPALICEDNSYSFAAMDALANQFANALSKLDFEPQSKIAIMCRNGPEYVAAHFGTAHTHNVLVHLSTRYAPSEVVHILNLTHAKLVIVDADTAKIVNSVRQELDEMPGLIGVGRNLPEGVKSFDEFIEGQPETKPLIDIHPDDPCSILFTGGTTGKPKGAITSHAARIISGAAAIEDHPILESDVASITTPLCHAAGMFSWFQPAICAGATCILMQRWHPGEFAQAVERHGITGAFVVPTQLVSLLDDPGFSPERLKTLRSINCGGALASDDTVERIERLLPFANFNIAYGSTETGHVLTHPPHLRKAKPGSLGHVGPRIELKILAPSGKEAARGDIGEIATRGAHLFSRYLNEPEQSQNYFRSVDGWGWTGDLGYMDEDGDIFLVGRSKDIIISGGLNIYPAEIENVVLELEEIKECAAFGVADKEWGELPVIAVVCEAGCDISPEDIIEHATNKIARYKRPRAVKFLDKLPYTAGGKIKRQTLRDEFSKT